MKAPKPKVKYKQYWIIKDKNNLIIKHMTWKEMENEKLASKLPLDNEHAAEAFREYLINKRLED